MRRNQYGCQEVAWNSAEKVEQRGCASSRLSSVRALPPRSRHKGRRKALARATASTKKLAGSESDRAWVRAGARARVHSTTCATIGAAARMSKRAPRSVVAPATSGFCDVLHADQMKITAAATPSCGLKMRQPVTRPARKLFSRRSRRNIAVKQASAAAEVCPHAIR